MKSPSVREVAYRLLLVEADTELSQALAQVLSEQGWQVTCACNRAEALKILGDAPRFDLLLVAQELPDGEGVQLVENLVLPPEPEQRTPILLLAEREDPQLLKRCFDLGINDYLVKPISPLLIGLKARDLTNKLRLADRVIQQKQELEKLLDASNREAEMASYVFYNNLLDHVSDTIHGFNRYINASSDFCGDLVLSKNSPSGSTFILHADAMGHGLSATMTLLPLVDVFHSMVSKGYALPMIVREMNRKLHFRLPPDRFVAASVVELDVLHEQVSIWNGGMPPVYYLDSEGRVINSYPSNHMALGILDNLSFESNVERFHLVGEGGLFGCSDGLTDQVNAQGKSYGNQRLLKSLEDAPRHSLMGTLVADLKEFSGVPYFDDDLSLFYVYFPELIYFQDQKYQLQGNQAHKLGIAPFIWELTLSGQQMGEQEIPALCNDYLQDMGFPQPFCQRAFTVISELSSNAIEHGLLKLKSSLKEDPEGFAEYYVLREQRLRKLTHEDQLRVRLQWQVTAERSRLFIEIEQSGEGFDFNQVMQQPREELAGRGLLLIRKLSTELMFKKQGRLAVATLE
ncbi:fused response regulator/phosphatase [Marinospirillum sp.]|uniref:ATP-binding SpoIIE family protein phosphatase n=1 Tax=Marinospirillum sp. TaxID=2183934 RepID=UPI00287076F7|nr:fused response regulator/phosphatase [Marinospirillum sp.]MDR9467673.1 fused response regulator/phosphatase [Marinospirillum sp.]